MTEFFHFQHTVYEALIVMMSDKDSDSVFPWKVSKFYNTRHSDVLTRMRQ